MSEASTRHARTLPTPVVLALCSLMVSIGVGAFFLTRADDAQAGEDARPTQLLAARDLSSPLGVAESFLDGWRKRDHETTLALSTGQARVEAQSRKDAERELDPESRSLRAQLWPRIANTRLRVEAERTRELGPGRSYVEGRAVGTFLDQPYVRRIAFELVETPEGTRVARMELGTIEQSAELIAHDEASGEDTP